jgi:hypothetical protein
MLSGLSRSAFSANTAPGNAAKSKSNEKEASEVKARILL